MKDTPHITLYKSLCRALSLQADLIPTPAPVKKEFKAKASSDIKDQIKKIRISVITAWNMVAADNKKVTSEEILGGKRKQHIVSPRQLAIYAARTLTSASLPVIGREFGGRDHTTIIHASKRAADNIRRGDDIGQKVLKLVAYGLRLSKANKRKLMNPPSSWTVKPKAP